MKGVLFADYVRMIRGHKGVDWSTHLEPEDLRFLAEKIDPSGWYPMTTFERLGNAILREIAHGDVEIARVWGQFSVDPLLAATPMLLAERDPVESLQRFRVLRSTFFDFEALEIPMLYQGRAHIVIHYHMGPAAEEAASHQTAGFFERLLACAGAVDVEAKFVQRAWTGDPDTLLDLTWREAR